MARGRFIAKTLGESRKFSQLPDGDTRMLYMLLVTNADKAGRVEADPLYITRKILTRLPYDEEFVECAIAAMHAVGLISLYDHNGIAYLQIEKFEDHNTPHHKEPDSKIPSPDHERSQARTKLDPSTIQACGKHEIMVAENRRELSRSESKGENPLQGSPPHAPAREGSAMEGVGARSASPLVGTDLAWYIPRDKS